MNITPLFPFWKTAEKNTVNKLLDVASMLLMTEEHIERILSLKKCSKLRTYDFREYLLQKANCSRLLIEINEIIRNHEVSCPCGCNSIYKLKQLRYSSRGGNDAEIMVSCDLSGELKAIPLGNEVKKSIEKLLLFAHIPPREIFENIFS